MTEREGWVKITLTVRRRSLVYGETFLGLFHLVFLWINECYKLPWEAGVKWEERICVSPDAREHGL
jgi:hypothetical protein